MRDANAGELEFRGGKLGPWIGRLGVGGGRASVRQTGERENEVFIAGRLSLADKHGRGFLIYPEGMAARAAQLFDRVEATVVTYHVIDAARLMSDSQS